MDTDLKSQDQNGAVLTRTCARINNPLQLLDKCFKKGNPLIECGVTESRPHGDPDSSCRKAGFCDHL